MFFDGYGYHGTSFEQTYRCYPASFIDKAQIENGDKVIMPPSALDRLASLHIDYPMLFELQNAAAERNSHCGVLEFIAEEGMIYMPYWGTYVKLQPHTKDFLDISNPKAILETTLRNFSCLTTGDSIMVAYNNKKYYIDIIETKPSNAISSYSLQGESLDGKPLKTTSPPVSSSGPQDKRTKASSGGGTAAASSSSSQSTSRQSQGKLVFGFKCRPNSGTKRFKTELLGFKIPVTTRSRSIGSENGYDSVVQRGGPPDGIRGRTTDCIILSRVIHGVLAACGADPVRSRDKKN
ncbi:Ubiquitin fusion degradation protein 1 [Sesamum alatum]|uniref:Ubiquitin fusion degradation protein 1 n=1 Tax=Sesamum alatum TaxID=300844 RepID=A0AAE1YXB2_9LAMI|nr:Ubiquitin fusion degradation protein 1 [Sesamum alatum]